MKKKLVIGASLAALLALPVLAAEMHAHRGHGPQGPETRAEVVAKVKERFAAADLNHDGVLTREEFDQAREVMKAKFAEHRAERRDERFASMDTNKDGQISKAEYDTAGAARARKWKEAEAGADGKPMRFHGRHRGFGGGMMGGDMFARMDANKDGKVTLAEAEAMPLAMFDKADTNHDGAVTPQERAAAHKAMRDAWKAKHKEG